MKMPATLGDDWPEMLSEEELIPAQAAIVDAEVPEISEVGHCAATFERCQAQRQKPRRPSATGTCS
jgi:hypothetical protein